MQHTILTLGETEALSLPNNHYPERQEESNEPPSWQRIRDLSQQLADSEERQKKRIELSEERQEHRHESNIEKLKGLREGQEALLEQQKLTNGRVSKVELTQAEQKGSLKVLLWIVIPVILLVVGAWLTKVIVGK
jgi:hypothetical protein